jgi:HD superfamily phosphodiesterase
LISFKEIKFEEPYPIIKAYVVPYRDNLEIINYRRVNSEDVESFRHVLEKLREFLKGILSSNIVKSYDDTRKLELIGDLISLYFKLPLLKEILPTTILNPLKIYFVYRVLLIPKYHKDLIRDPISFIENIYNIKEDFLDFIQQYLMNILADENLCKDIERSWFIFPSDTRPGYNTSGLIPHLLLTSAIAWSLAINKKLNRTEIAILRLASLLHDIGKPFNYREHVKISKSIAKLLLDGLIPSDTLNKVIDIISKHHYKPPIDELSDILEKADNISSAIDRVNQLVESYLESDLKSIAMELNLNYEDGFETGEKAWNFWIKINEKYGLKKFEDLNSKFLKQLREETNGFRSQAKSLKEIKSELEEDYKNVLIGIIDIAKIQKFISRSQEIKITSGASLLIDYLVMAYLPFYIQLHMDKIDEYDMWIPYEAFIYNAGGVVEFIVPKLFINKFERIIEDELNDILSKNAIKVTFAYASFHNNIYLMVKELTNNLHLKKNLVKSKSMKITRVKTLIGYDDLCQLCYLDNAKKEILTPEGPKRVCNVCESLYNFGSNISFKSKYDAKITINGSEVTAKDVYDPNWERVSKYIIELISGHDCFELEKLTKKEGIKLRNIAILKIDGNLMGPFIATSISLTDMYERSARIDIALKNAIRKALTTMYESIAKSHGNVNEALKLCISTLFGILYIGGDDALIIMPSWASIAFSWIIGNEFRLNMGESRGISIGIAVGSAKSNLWNLISAAQGLMSEGKKSVRENPEYSIIMYDIAEGETLNDLIVKERIENFKNRKISIQPFTLSKDKDSLREYIQLLFEVSNYNEFIEKCYFASRYLTQSNMDEKIKKIQTFIKNIKNGIIECINRADSFIIFSDLPQREYELLKLIIMKIYSNRQYARFNEKKDSENAKIYKIISELCFKGELHKLLEEKEDHNLNASFSDAYRMIKIIGGGVI